MRGRCSFWVDGCLFVCVTCSFFSVDGWVFVYACACMQAILYLANNYELVVLQILQHGIGLRLPSIRVFQDCGAEPARLGGPAILVSVLVPTFHKCPKHACTCIPLIPTFILLSLFQLLQYKREVGAVQEPFLSLSERIRSPTWEGASKWEHNPHAQEELASQEHICNKCSASCYLVCSSGNFDGCSCSWWFLCLF